jgi:aminoglycoside phosphotransferase
MRIPNKIKEYVGEYYIDEVKDYHVSGDGVFNICNKYILKISNNIERLKREYEKDKWFKNVLPVPTPIIFIVEDNTAYYLKEYIDGEVLCLEKYLNTPNTLIKLLKEALTMFHNVDVTNCPFIVGDGNTIIHGDFCLPNILVKDNRVVGFIDLEAAGVGDIWCDYAWCIWSLEYNTGTDKYTNQLLKELNIVFDEEKFLKYTCD